jgi:hypothetical protein
LYSSTNVIRKNTSTTMRWAGLRWRHSNRPPHGEFCLMKVCACVRALTFRVQFLQYFDYWIINITTYTIHLQAHNPNNYERALMSAPPQGIAPNPHTNLPNNLYRLQIKWGLKKSTVCFLLISYTWHVSNVFTCFLFNLLLWRSLNRL